MMDFLFRRGTRQPIVASSGHVEIQGVLAKELAALDFDTVLELRRNGRCYRVTLHEDVPPGTSSEVQK